MSEPIKLKERVLIGTCAAIKIIIKNTVKLQLISVCENTDNK